MSTLALLALQDGSLFWGRSIGSAGQSVGEVVFNTAMTGYQEILTDPSYARQLVTLTYPHIGNVGVNADDEESDKIQCAGLIIRDLPLRPSSFRSEKALDQYLREQGVVAIADIDTRRLTRILRKKGAQNGCLVAGEQIDENAALEAARAFPGLKGMDLAKEVTTGVPYEWAQGSSGRASPHRGETSLPCGGLRLRRQAQHPAHAGGSRLPPDGGACTDTGRRNHEAQSRRRVPFKRAG